MSNRVYLDTEFLDTGSWVLPLSFGLKADDGSEYYAVSKSMDQASVYNDPFHNDQTMRWFPKSKWPTSPPIWLDNHHSDVKPLGTIRNEIERFFTEQIEKFGPVDLYAFYAAHDFIVLTQLWGPLNQISPVVPWYINDLRSEMRRLGLDPKPEGFPVQTEGKHHALHDARFDKVMGDWMIAYEERLNG